MNDDHDLFRHQLSLIRTRPQRARTISYSDPTGDLASALADRSRAPIDPDTAANLGAITDRPVNNWQAAYLIRRIAPLMIGDAA